MWIAAFYALSMAMLGFAHAAGPAVFPEQTVDLSAYTLPDGDGSLSLCLNGEDGKLPQASAGLCDACVLTASPGLLSCAAIPLPARTIEPLAVALPESRAEIAAHSGHVPHLRGPPAA